MSIVIRPVAAMTVATLGLANGQLNIAMHGVNRRDELGALAQSLEVFRALCRRSVNPLSPR
jgi:hypothetical protein